MNEKISNVVKNRNNSSLQILPSDSPDSKVENNNAFMRNNYERGGSYYNLGVSSGHCFMNAQNNSSWARTFDKISLDEKLFLLSLREEDSKLMIPKLSEIDYLMEVYNAEYKMRLLSKLLDYDKIINHPCLSKDYNSETSIALENPLQKLDFSRLSQGDLAVIEAYRVGVGLLKLGREKDGKQKIKEAVDGGLPHAKYVYAIIIFKNILQYHMGGKSGYPSQRDINEAIKYMHQIRRDFFPLPSFVLGIMQSYNQMFNKKIAAKVTSARECFKDVLSGIGNSEYNYTLIAPRKYIVMEDESVEYFKWIVQSAKYELARDMLLYPEDLSCAKSLLLELSSDFADAKVLYALALLKNAFHDKDYFKKKIFCQAYTLLEESIKHGHKEAMFFFGTLPFRQEFKLLDKESQSCKGSYAFRYLGKYLEACGTDGKFKTDAAILIAAEYVNPKSSYVIYDEENAKYVLRENSCLYELQELKKKIKERQEQANNALPDILGALEQMYDKLKSEPSSHQLSSAVKELLEALQNSGLMVQKSRFVYLTLQQLHICSTHTVEQKFFLPPLQTLYFIVEAEVVNQSHCSSQKKVLSPLRNLLLTCVELQRNIWYSEHSQDLFQDFSGTEISTTLQIEQVSNISRIPSEDGQSPPLCSTKNSATGPSEVLEVSSVVSMITPTTELSGESARSRSVERF